MVCARPKAEYGLARGAAAVSSMFVKSSTFRKKLPEEARKLGVDIHEKRRRDTLHVAPPTIGFANGTTVEGDAAIVCVGAVRGYSSARRGTSRSFRTTSGD